MTPEQKPSIAPQLVKRYERYLTALKKLRRCDSDLNTKAATLGDGGCVPDELLRIGRIRRALRERTLPVLVLSKAKIEANIFRRLPCSDQEKVSETLTFENKGFLPKGSVENVLLNLAKKSLPDSQKLQDKQIVIEKKSYSIIDIATILGSEITSCEKRGGRITRNSGMIREIAKGLKIDESGRRKPHFSTKEAWMIINEIGRKMGISKDIIGQNVAKLMEEKVHVITFNGKKYYLNDLQNLQLKIVEELVKTSEENPIYRSLLAEAVYGYEEDDSLTKKNMRKLATGLCLTKQKLRKYGLQIIAKKNSRSRINDDNSSGDRLGYYLLEKNVSDKIDEAKTLQLRQGSNEGLRQFCMADIAELSGLEVYSYAGSRQAPGFIRKIALRLGIDEARKRLPRFTQEEAEKIKEEVRKVQAAGRPGRTHNRGEEAPLAASTVPVVKVDRRLEKPTRRVVAQTAVILERSGSSIRNGMPAAHVEKETDSRPSLLTDEDVFVLMQGLIEMLEKGLLPVDINLKHIKSDEVRHVMGRVGMSLYPGSDSPYSESNLKRLEDKINMFKNDKEKFLKGCSDVSRSLLSFFDDELKIKIIFDAIEGLKKPVRYVSQVS